MSRRFAFPDVVLEQHIAVLGKTGSGKSSTSKLAIEQAVAGGARVCVLDPIKSDWWGLTSSADGQHAGLPFHILGGPHGHVPLHSSAGKAIAEVVASGALPLSIVDMADFEPGGQARFFVDFAPTLLRKMRGVVYLVLEEAHLFAPKERSGIGQENLAIHWAKTLATAGRSKGVRLVLVTQRTQALHNALLGSCDTVIAHRLTAPADQKPVVKWLEANTSKAVLEQVAGSLSSLKTGEGWICAGEARLFERVHFPRIGTYDNTATPNGAGETREITTAAVDAAQLRALIGDAVEQAKADDPKELRRLLAQASKDAAASARRISELEARGADTSGSAHAEARPKPDVPVLSDDDRALLTDIGHRLSEASRLATVNRAFDVDDFLAQTRAALDRFKQDLTNEAKDLTDVLHASLADQGFQRILTTLLEHQPPASPLRSQFEAPSARATRPSGVPASMSLPRELGERSSRGPADLPKGEATVLTCVAQYPDGASREQISILTGYKRSTRDLYLQQLQRRGAIDAVGGTLHVTAAGMALLGPDFEPLPTGTALIEHWRQRLPTGERSVFEVLVAGHGRVVDRDRISEDTGYKRSTRDLYIQQLTRRRLAVSDRGGVRAAAELFA